MDLQRAAQPGMTEREHHGWGALLKYAEALAIAYRYDRYRRNSKTGKRFERFLKATRELRDQLNLEYGWVAAEHLSPKSFLDPDFRVHYQEWLDARQQALTSSVYYGDELRDLQRHVIFEIEDGPPERMLEVLGLDPRERELYHKERRAVLTSQVEKLVAEARSQTHQLPWDTPASLVLAPPPLPTPAALPKSNRHADLRLAMRETPDQPQAAFVKRFRVHPITVRRCRRELEEAGAIPFLAHRHAQRPKSEAAN